MVCILDGNFGIGAQVREKINLFKAVDWISCSRNFDIHLYKTPVLLHTCATRSKLPIDVHTMYLRGLKNRSHPSFNCMFTYTC